MANVATTPIVVPTNPSTRQEYGIWMGIITAIVIGLAIYGILDHFLDFWHVGEILGIGLGVFVGGMAGLLVYFSGWRSTDLNWVAILLSWGTPTGEVFGPGFRWYAPWESARNVPDSSKNFILAMEGEKIDTQDGVTVYFGLEGDGGKKNELQYSIVDPIRYIAMDNPEMEIQSAYLEEARIVLGQSAAAIGVKNERSLFSDFLMLRADIRPGDEDYLKFEQRLTDAKFKRRDDDKKSDSLYSPDSVKTIMARAGVFRQKCRTWGIGKIKAFTPNVRENPETEAAAAKKQAAVELMKTLQITAGAVTEETKKMLLATHITPDLAGLVVAALQGQKVDLANKTYAVSGLPEAIRGAVETFLNTFSKGTT